MTSEQTEHVKDFFATIRSGDADRLRALLAERPDLAHARDANAFGSPPLSVAIHHRNDEMVDLLLKHGADPSATSDWWAGPFTPLVSIPQDRLELIEGIGDATRGGPLSAKLIDAGAHVGIHEAAHLGMVDRIVDLLDHDPSLITARGGDGQHPLHFAASVPVARALLERGADMEARDVDHESTPAQWMLDRRRDVAGFLVDRGAEMDPFMAVMLHDLARLEALIASEPEGVDVRVTHERFPCSNDGRAAGHIYMFMLGDNTGLLHAAAKGGTGATATWLIEAGADPGWRAGYDDGTPLHVAAWHDNTDVIGALLDGGADIDTRSGSMHNNTPLGWAIVGGAAGSVDMLLRRGATVLDFFAEDAVAGTRGEFTCYSGSPIEAWTTIHELIERHT